MRANWSDFCARSGYISNKAKGVKRIRQKYSRYTPLKWWFLKFEYTSVVLLYKMFRWGSLHAQGYVGVHERVRFENVRDAFVKKTTDLHRRQLEANGTTAAVYRVSVDSAAASFCRQ